MVVDAEPNKRGDQKKPLCFVVGPIGKNGTAERRHSDLLLHGIFKPVLQQDEFGYIVKRADEDADPGMIGDRVISDIVNAELVIADLTDLNPNAFYELGIRHATEKPTIHFAKSDTVLPFDTNAQRTIFVDVSDWHSQEDARARLADAVRAIKAPGYKVSNPITQANASFRMRQSEDPRDRVVADMQERLASMGGVGVRPPSFQRNMQELMAAFKGALSTMQHSGATNDEIYRELHRLGAELGVELSKVQLEGNTLTFETADGTRARMSSGTHERQWTSAR